MVKNDGLVTKDLLKTELQKIREEITTMKDEILGELKSMREDDFAHQFQR